MIEPSGDIQHAEKTQVTETKEKTDNFGLSVNGSQLIALANLNHLEEHGFTHPVKPDWMDKLKTLKNRPALRRLNAIKGLVLERKMQEAKNLLQQAFTLPNQVLDEQKVKEEIIDALSRNISAEEAFKDHLKFNKVFREFIQSLPGKPFYELPKKNTRIFLTQLGIEAYVYPESNRLRLSPKDVLLDGRLDLPADQQHPFYFEEKEVLGESNNDTVISRLEIFAELAKRYPKVFTHITSANFLPAILNSGYIGKPYEKGTKGGTIQSERGGIYIETLTFRDAPEYTKTIEQLKTNGKITAPADIPEGKKGSYPFHELEYIAPHNINPIAIFSDQFPKKHNMAGWLADDVADIKDDCLIGIVVTPQYKEHLLHWVSTWTDEKRQEVFGERKPEEVLISSAKDLPPLEK